MLKYKVDKKKRKYILNKAYKETEEWKQEKAKRIIFCYTPLLLPVIFAMIVAFIYYVLGFKAYSLWTWPLLAMPVLWSVGFINMNAIIFNRTLIPTNRKNDVVRINDEELIYTYKCRTDKMDYKYSIRYNNISKMEYSDKRKTLFVFGKYSSDAMLGGKRICCPKGNCCYITIPMYFDEDMMKELMQLSKKDIVVIEENPIE